MKKKTYRKRSVPVDGVRRWLEPGPLVWVTSCWKGERDVMTMGWQTVMAFTPSLVGCVIDAGNHTFDLVRRSKECVLNIPTADLMDEVIGIGNSSGDEIDKFERFGLTPVEAVEVKAPLLAECFASFECRLYDARLVREYNFFVWEVVKAHVAPAPRFPKTLHYHGGGILSTDGAVYKRARQFTKWRGAPNF